jgi:uncharacterized protein
MGQRSDLEFPSGKGSCAAWLYRPGAARSRPGPCVVMAHGFSLTRHDGLAAFAEPLTAAEDSGIAAVTVLCPFVDGLARVLATPLATVAWVVPRAIANRAGKLVHIPVTGPDGAKAAMAFTGEGAGFASVVTPESPWRNEITPGVFLTVALHRPVAKAKKVACPLWVGLGEGDISVSRRSVQRLAARAPQGELHRYPYDHWEPCVGDAPARIAADQVDFLRRCGVLGA